MSQEPKTKCPACGGRRFQLVVRQMVDMEFRDDGDHDIVDGPYGDIDWDDDSFAICRHDGCGWSGQLKELT